MDNVIPVFLELLQPILFLKPPKVIPHKLIFTASTYINQGLIEAQVPKSEVLLILCSVQSDRCQQLSYGRIDIRLA